LACGAYFGFPAQAGAVTANRPDLASKARARIHRLETASIPNGADTARETYSTQQGFLGIVKNHESENARDWIRRRVKTDKRITAAVERLREAEKKHRSVLLIVSGVGVGQDDQISGEFKRPHPSARVMVSGMLGVVTDCENGQFVSTKDTDARQSCPKLAVYCRPGLKL
jgi:hypothetical protein